MSKRSVRRARSRNRLMKAKSGVVSVPLERPQTMQQQVETAPVVIPAVPLESASAIAFERARDSLGAASSIVIQHGYVADSVTVAHDREASDLLEGFQPFPVDCLPKPIGQYVEAQAKSLDCDVAAVVLPVLAVLASSIGSRRRIQLKKGRTEPATLWTAVIADRGTALRQPLEAAVDVLQARYGSEARVHQQRAQEHARQMAEYQSRSENRLREGDSPILLRGLRKIGTVPDGSLIGSKSAVRNGDYVDLPEELEARSIPQYVSADWSLSSVVRLLNKGRSEKPRGLLVCNEDLDGWLGRTAGGSRRAVQLSQWSDLHRGQGLTVLSRNQATPALPLPEASVCVTGTLSPDVVIQNLKKPHSPCGLLGRILLAYPPNRPRRWTDDEVDDDVSAGYSAVVNRLLDLDATDANATGDGVVTLSADAKRCYAEFISTLDQEQTDADEVLGAALGHLEGAAARLGLVLHQSRWAAGEAVNPDVCDVTSMQQGIKLAMWFANETRRIHALLSEPPEAIERRSLVEWLQQRGGRATARDLCRAKGRRYGTMDSATDALQRLVEQKIGTWVDRSAGEKGGRPYREFVLGELVVDVVKEEETLVTDDDDKAIPNARPLTIPVGSMNGVRSQGLISPAVSHSEKIGSVGHVVTSQ